jgi:diguanylate cyclase (GGDEF)-like protein
MDTGPSHTPTPAASMRVLIVEDCEDDAVLLTHELKHAAGEVVSRRVDTADGMRAALREGDWDLVISDHAMPCFSSTEAYDLLRSCGKDIPFIIYSGHISENAAVTAMNAGVHDFVEKGNLRRLLPVVRRELKTVAEVRARAQAERLLDSMTRYDQLTGLPTREVFEGAAAAILSDRIAAGQGATLLFIDIDRFMRINNTFGYAIGDLLVQEIAARLKEVTGTEALLTRLGRDEFALIDAGTQTVEEATLLARRLMERFLAPFRIEGQEFYITLSIGVCRCPDDGTEIGALLVNAENAMFWAKRSGRNTFQLYVRDLNAASGERLVMETSLRHAVKRGEFLLHYQPSVLLSTGEVVGTEALIRWRHPTLGMVPPDRFIPLADETGLIGEIGQWVLEEACAQTRRWHDAGFSSLTISVNVSAVQFRQGGLTQIVRDVLDRTGLPARCLDLEITETVLMQDADATIATLRQIKAMGVHVSVDDFGTGYSSLAYLKRFPIDTLKIDKSFVRDVTCDEHNAAIVRTVITLARSLGLESIAEGVEEPDQIEFMRREGCDRLQGYCFSKPLAPALLLELLRSGRTLASA